MTDYPGIRQTRHKPETKTLKADVCVVGAGASGLSAALETRALGRSVILADAAPQIGGQAVGSAIGTICGLYSNGPNPHRVTHGVMDEMLSSLVNAGQAAPRRARNTVILDYSINGWQRWAEDRIVETGVTPLFGATLREVNRDDGMIKALTFATRFGDVRVEAKSFIDASGDAVIPWLSGLELNEADQEIYGTTMAVFENVNTDIVETYPRSRFHEAMRRRGAEFGLVRFDGFIFPVAGGGKVLANQTHIETRLDPVALSLSGIAGRAQVDGLLALFRDEFPEAFAEANVAIYGQPGIRQTRTIQARTRITVEDVRSGKPPQDQVVRCSWPIELHTELADTYWDVFDDDHMHHIPYGAMTPAGLDNVIVAGRCIDAEPAALASVRVMGPCFGMGRAAAVASDLAGSGSIHQIDIAALQDQLEDNLGLDTRDPWLDRLVQETGPEAGRG